MTSCLVAQPVSPPLPSINDTAAVKSYVIDVSRQASHESDQNEIKSALQHIFSAYVYSRYLPDTSRALYIFYRDMANVMHNIHFDNRALLYNKKAFETVKKVPRMSRINVYHRAVEIGNLYSASSDYDSAMLYYNAALHEAQSCNEKIYESSAYNNIGMLMANSHHPEALQYYEKALAYLPDGNKNTDGLYASIQDNIAEWELDNQQFELSLSACAHIYEWVDYMTTAVKDYDFSTRRIKTLLKEARCYEGLGNIPKAIDILESNQVLIKSNSEPAFYRDALKLLAGYYYKTGQSQQSYNCFDLLYKWNNTVTAKEDLKNKAAIDALLQADDFMFTLESNEADAKAVQLNDNLKSERSRLKFLLLFTVIGGVIAYVLYQRLFNLHTKKVQLMTLQQELNHTRLEKEQLERENAEASVIKREKDLSALILQMTVAREWQITMAEELDKLGNATQMSNHPLFVQTMNDLRTKLSVDERTGLLDENRELLNRSFLEPLKTQYPRLTEDDLEMCRYLRLRMSAKDIASLRNISVKSVEMSRYRLRKKLELDPETDLVSFLLSI